MHITAVCPEPSRWPERDRRRGSGSSTDRGAPPSHPASSPAGGAFPDERRGSLTSEVSWPGERERDRSPRSFFARSPDISRCLCYPELSTRRCLDDSPALAVSGNRSCLALPLLPWEGRSRMPHRLLVRFPQFAF